MTPKEHFKKSIIGKLTTRKISELSIDGVSTSIDEEKDFDIIDVVQLEKDKFFVVNQWEDESTHTVMVIHNNFVKDSTLNEPRTK